MRPFLVATLVLLLAAAGASAQSSAERVLAATLENGLRVLLQEDHRSPVVSFQMWYRVGSRNEARGATGIAHFLEHMMFKGTPTYGQGQFARLVEQNGGQDNAFTSQDVTSYYVNIAADKIDLVIELEADRMHNLKLDAKDIGSEREAVIEARRKRGRRVVVREQAQLPIVYLGYRVPNQKSGDAFAREMLSSILCEGRASRLYRRLV